MPIRVFAAEYDWVELYSMANRSQKSGTNDRTPVMIHENSNYNIAGTISPFKSPFSGAGTQGKERG